jgi:hypothetical protein
MAGDHKLRSVSVPKCLARNVYALKSDAFAHFAVQESFDLEFEDAVEYCNVGGA